jgi:hypothetical protein
MPPKRGHRTVFMLVWEPRGVQYKKPRRPYMNGIVGACGVDAFGAAAYNFVGTYVTI